MLPPLRNCLVVFGLVLFLAPLAASQQTPSSPPHAPADQEQIVAYWTTETGWKSELELRNNLIGSDLTVTPVLRAADGTETPLQAVTIKSQEVKAIDLEAALAATAPQLIGTYGSVVLRYRSMDDANLYAVLMVRNIGHPFAFHIDGLGETEAYQSASREGIWWLPNDTASDYLVLTNQGKNPLSLDLSLFDASGRESRQKLALGPRATSRFSVRQLVRAAGLTGSYGGIKVFAAAHAGSLDTLHVLFDEKASFSAILKMFDHNPSATLKQRDHAGTGVWTLRAPMLAVSNPDPALRFPPGTLLRPQLLIRNTIGKPVDAALRFNWYADTTSGKAAGPALHLTPYETRRIDVAALQNAGLLPAEAHWASVTLTTSSLPDEVMAVATSYDDTLKYGAQTPFSDQLSRKWEGSAWEYDAQHDSIITAGNGGTKPIQAAFTIFYNQGAQKYELEQTLQPDKQMWLYIGKLIREHVPDKNGKLLPADLTSGSYEIRDLTNKAIGTLFEGKVIYDKTYGHAAYGCGSCCGYGVPRLSLNPLGVPLSSFADNTVVAHDSCTGLLEDVGDAFYQHWSTANTSIVTVNGTGTHSGVSMGSTTSQTCGDLQSNLRTLQCPINNNCPGGGDNVTPIITSISPNTVLVGSNNVQLTINGRGFGSSPTVNLPAGVTAPNGQGSTDSQILITVNVSTNATISPNSITVTANSQTSNKGSFTLDGPFYMTVQADRVQTCSGCTSAIERLTTYQVMLFSGSVAPASLPLGESYTTTGESCTGVGYPVPGTCPETNTSYFTDRWTMGANYTPAGCGYNITDHWQWCAPSPPRTVGTLTGYIHTNAVSINGVVNPPNGFITGTVINP